jgi:hypothetical protein
MFCFRANVSAVGETLGRNEAVSLALLEPNLANGYNGHHILLTSRLLFVTLSAHALRAVDCTGVGNAFSSSC